MEYNTKLPKNNKGYLVGNRCFETLAQAEAYCNANDFDPNEFIQYDKVEALRISSVISSELDELKDSIYSMFQKVREEIQNIQKLKDENKDKRWIMRESYEDQQQRLIGELEGLSKAHSMLCNRSIAIDKIKYSYRA